MPQANKKRGRRMGGNKKRKLEEDDVGDGGVEVQAESSSTKRRKSVADLSAGDDEDDSYEDHAPYTPLETQFFGTLDDEEQEYFKRADDVLEANAFAEQEERDIFIANVYREADGKELKLAQSQSCSRLMERLLQMSSPAQLKALFQKFAGSFVTLITHRFSGHCCEALFLRAAPVVSDELLAGKQDGVNGSDVSMETLFLQTVDELEGNVGYLVTDQYASHALRILMVVLSGQALDAESIKRLLQSKRKEKNAVQGAGLPGVEALEKPRNVPQSFGNALEKIIADSVSGLDTDKLRALATHPIGNPTLQILLQLELMHYGKSRGKDEHSIIRTLLPDEPITPDTGSAKFITGLVYDPIGSHLVEKIVTHAPAKMFKMLFSEFFRERLAQHARNEIAGYVVCRVLERLGQDDLHIAHEELIPVLTNLLQRGQTIVVRTLIERCTIRDIDTKAIAVQVHATWDTPDGGFEVEKLLKWGHGLDVEPDAAQQPLTTNTTPSTTTQPAPPSSSTTNPTFARPSTPMKAHYNLLAQAMLIVPGPLSSLVLESLVALPTTTLLPMAHDPIVSRTLQAALTSRNASMITTRKLIQRFYGHMAAMALDPAASFVVDCMWEGTHGLAFIRERIAEELAEEERNLRESICGRAVWRNWKMDLYKRRRQDWVRQSKIKASNDGFQSFAELDEVKEGVEGGAVGGEGPVVGKSPIEVARERFAREKREKKEKEAGKSGGGGGGGSSQGVKGSGSSSGRRKSGGSSKKGSSRSGGGGGGAGSVAVGTAS